MTPGDGKNESEVTPAEQAYRAEVGQRIEKRRRDLKVSQDDLGKAIGVSQPVISKIEKGRIAVNLEYVRGIAARLDTTQSFFLGEEPPAGDRQNKPEPPESNGILKLLSDRAHTLAPGLADYLQKHARTLTLEMAELMMAHSTRPVEPITYDEDYWDRVRGFYTRELEIRRKQPEGREGGAGRGKRS